MPCSFQYIGLIIMLDVGFLKMSFIRLRKCLFLPGLLRVIIMSWCWNLLNVFSIFIQIIMWFLSFVNMVYYSSWFLDVKILNQPYIPWINTIWSWCVVLFYVSGFDLLIFLLRIFTAVSMKDSELRFLFLDILPANFLVALRTLFRQVKLPRTEGRNGEW